MGKGSSPPAAPNYTEAAKAQGAANVDTARVEARLSNPNIISPYGTQTVSYGQPVFDQSAYDKAMAAYNATPAASTSGHWEETGSGYQSQKHWVPDSTPTAKGPAPTREQFTSNPTADTPTITQTLSPENQQLLAAQQGVQLGLADTSKKALGTVQGVMGKPFDYNGPDIQTELAKPGQINPGPAANQYGLASGKLDLSNVAKMPVNAGMTGQNALMARLGPQLAQQRQQAETQLRNQGLVPGGEAYGNAMTIENQRENDLRSQAALYGINLDLGANQQGYNQALQSGQFGNQAIGQNFGQGLAAAQQQNQAQNLGFNQGLAGAEFGNTAQQQALQQQLYQRELPLNEITALMSGSQVSNPQFPQYRGANVEPPPLFNATQGQYNAGLQGYGMQNNADNAFSTGLMNLAGSGATAYAMYAAL